MSPGARLQDLTAKYMQNPRRFFVPLANEYRQAGELDRAIALCREHLPAQPGHMSGHIVLGRAYFEKGDTVAARDVFLTSVALDDENVIALRHLGDIARLRSEIAEARQWYARVLDADPQNAEIERLLRALNEAARPVPPARGDVSLAPPPETVRPPLPPSTLVPDPWDRPASETAAERPAPRIDAQPWERSPSATVPPQPPTASVPVAPVSPPPAVPGRPAEAPTRWEQLADALPTERPAPALEPWERRPPVAVPAPVPVAAAPMTPPVAAPVDGLEPWERPITPPLEALRFEPAAPTFSGREPVLPSATTNEPTPLRALTFVRPEPTTAHPTPMHQLPPSDFDLADAAAVLAEPTPPGLRAIMGETPARTPAQAPAPVGPGEPSGLPAQPAPQPEPLGEPLGERVGERVAAPFAQPLADGLHDLSGDLDALPPMMGQGDGFAYDDLDSLSDGRSTDAAMSPLDGGWAGSAGDESVPGGLPVTVPELLDSDVVAPPAFGALASFAAWREARERNTPISTPAIVAAPVEPEPEFAPSAEMPREAREMVDPSELPAGEFETETMALLYAQQGFTEQALTVYRTLARRTPTDTGLQARIRELETQVGAADSENSLQVEADKALSFGEFEVEPAVSSSTPSMLESMYELSPPRNGEPTEPRGTDAQWGGAALERSADDDWFAEEHDPLTRADSTTPAEALFGLPTGAIVEARTHPTPRDGWASSSQSGSASVATLATIFAGLDVAGADAAASTLLVELANQMVGRLPKDAPTLPVPDVLELPAGPATDGGTAAQAPLLSFDRFFAGGGAPPRARIDTPSSTRPTGAMAAIPLVAPPKVSPSLSPTFGGLPVIAPPPSATTAPWSSFDSRANPGPPSASSAVPAPGEEANADQLPVPESVRAETDLVPVVYVTTMPAAELPETAEPEPRSPTPMEPVSTPVTALPPETPSADAVRNPPSDFHRWLEGLS